MSATEADPFWDASAPFEDQARPNPKTARKKKSGTEAEIVLPAPSVDDDEDAAVAPPPRPKRVPGSAIGKLVPLVDNYADDEDEEPGEPIDGSEDDITALEEQAATAALVGADVAPDDRVSAAVSRAAAKRSVQMAETKTKAESIRDEIARRKAAGETTIRPRDVIASLAEKGVTVTAPQVSVTLRDWGKSAAEKKPRTQKPAKTIKSTKLADAVTAAEKAAKRATARVSANAPTPTPAPAANRPSYAALEAAAAFSQAQGGVKQAKDLLEAYARLFNPAG